MNFDSCPDYLLSVSPSPRLPVNNAFGLRPYLEYIRKRGCVVSACLLALWCASLSAGTLETVNMEDLPRKVINLPNNTTMTFISYGDRSWREIAMSVLTGSEVVDKDVCLEAKFDFALPPDKLKLFNSRGTVIVDDHSKFKAASALKRGDNLFLCGELQTSKKEKGVELLVVMLAKELPDLQKYQRRIAMLEKKNDGDSLMETGHRIEELRKNAQFNLDEFDKLGLLRDKAWKTGLTIKMRALSRDDADAMFALALQWRDLLHNNSQFRMLAEQALRVDPDHPRAGVIAEQDLRLKKFEGKWLQESQIKDIQTARDQERRRLNEAERLAAEAKNRMLAKVIADRSILLIKAQIALRSSGQAAREKAIRALGEAISASLDAGFGEEAVDVLANLSDRAAVKPGLELAAQSGFPEVRRKVFAALVWRGRQQDDTALPVLGVALSAEKDSLTVCACVDALVSFGGNAAVRALMRGLMTDDRSAREEIIEGLKLIAKQQITSKEGWETWWSQNKDAFN
ncbi:MAG: HEAT repeat domain-containing protein [Planctomycetota bacterium]